MSNTTTRLQASELKEKSLASPLTPNNSSSSPVVNTKLKSIVPTKKASDKKATLSDQFRDLEASLITKFKSLLSEFESNFNKKISDAISSLETRVLKFESDISELRDDNQKLKEALSDLHRKERLRDVIVRGIPMKPDERPADVAKAIASKLHHQITPHFDAFRLKTKSTDGNCPLLIRLSSHMEQSALLAAFRSNGGLTVEQLENESHTFDHNNTSTSATRIYINESLTQENSSLLRNALQLRREGLLFSARTRNGHVYIRKTKDDTEVKIDSTTILT